MILLSGLIAWFTDPDNWSGAEGVPARLLEHLQISAYALLAAAVIAIPTGVITGHLRRFGGLITTLGNLGRAVPVFAVLVILASWDSIGVSNTAAIVALAVFAIPPLLTNTYVGIRDVDPDSLDAARGMGMTGGQVLRRVEFPMAVPLLAAGARTAVVQVVATATLAALVGGGGLGRYVVDGFGRQDTTLLLAGVVLVALLSVVTELVLAVVQRWVTPPPLRLTSVPTLL